MIIRNGPLHLNHARKRINNFQAGKSNGIFLNPFFQEPLNAAGLLILANFRVYANSKSTGRNSRKGSRHAVAD
jgi:hypothetical protein